MKQCLIYNGSLRFARAVYGTLTLVAFLIRNEWLVLATAILMIMSAISTKINIPYQIHAFVVQKVFGKRITPAQKEFGEISFVSAMTALLLLLGFALVYFTSFVDPAWMFILVVALLIFLACFVGFCIATMMYIAFRRLWKKS